MHIRQLLAALITTALAWGGLVIADLPKAAAVCPAPCSGDPAVHAFVNLNVQGLGTSAPAGSLTGGHLSAACATSCTDSWTNTASTAEDTETYTVSANSGWAVDHWTGCSSGGGTTTTCTVTPAYSTSSAQTSGNTVEVAVYFRDTSPPTAQITSGPPTYTNQAVTFTFISDGTGTAATTTCAVDGGSYAPCSSPYDVGLLSDGPHTFTLRATDAGGNAAQASRSFTVDTQAPTTAISSGPVQGSYVNSTSASFTFSATDPNIVRADCGDAASDAAHTTVTRDACGSFTEPPNPTPVGWQETLTNLPQGLHTWTVRAVDKAGNTSQQWRSWYVDSIAPTATFTGGLAEGSTTSNTAPTFDFALDGTGSTATATCRLDGPVSIPPQPCTSDHSEALTGLADGTYLLTLHLGDQAGNTADVARSFRVDTSQPTLSIDSGPAAGSYLDSTIASFGFTAGNGTASINCQLDQDASRACASNSTDVLTNLSDGSHIWTVRATNAAGTSTTQTRTFTVDTAPPTGAITSGVADNGFTVDPTSEFGFVLDGTGSAPTAMCAVDDAQATACTTATSYITPVLADGTHTVRVIVGDAAGNTTAVTRTFTVDLSKPTVGNTSSWPMFATTNTLVFAWHPGDSGSGIASSDVQVQHAGPASGFSSWSSPSGWVATKAQKLSVSAIRGDTYCFRVRAHDIAGNTSNWSPPRCTALPIDDASLSHSPHWKKIVGGGLYGHSASQTSTRGATLTSHTVQARHIRVIVTTCPRCGTIGIYRGKTLLKKISLAGAKTHRRVEVPAWAGRTATSGVIRIKVLSATGRLVQVDGLEVTRL